MIIEKYKKSQFNISYYAKNDVDSWIYANTYSGCIMFADQEMSNFLENYSNDSLMILNNKYPDIANYLIDNGFLVRENLDELKRIRSRFQENKFAKHFLNLTLMPTSACNLDCSYCYQETHTKSFSSSIVEQLKQFVSNYISKIKHLNITWYGGEPLLKKILFCNCQSILFKYVKRMGYPTQQI